jgi:hypothetical protein
MATQTANSRATKGKAPPPRKVLQLPQPQQSVTVVAVPGVIAVPRHALLRLALVFHDIKRSQEIRHAQAA